MNDDKIRRAFRALQRDVTRATSPADRLAEIRRDRWWHRALLPATGLAVAALLVAGVFAALGNGSGEPVAPAPSSTTTATSLPPTTTTTAPVTPSTTEPAPGTTVPVTPPSSDVVAPFDPIPPGALIIATPNGLVVEDGSAQVRSITATPTRIAVSDGYGGIVYQPMGEYRAWEILRIGPEGGTPQLLASGPVALHNIAIIDGVPTVLYVHDNSPLEAGSNLGDYTGTVRLFRLDGDGERDLASFPTYEGGIFSVSYGAGLFAISAGSEGESWMHFVDRDGNAAGVVNPRPYEEAVDGHWYSDPVLSPDGEMLVFLQADGYPFGSDGAPMHLVLWDIVAGTQIGRGELPLGAFDAGRMDFDGNDVLVSRRQFPGDDATALLISGAEIDVATTATASVAGTASLAREIVTGDTPAPEVLPGAGPGYLVTDFEEIVWVPMDSVPGAPDARVLVRFADPIFDGGSNAVSDGSGGYIYTRGSGATWWVRADGRADVFTAAAWVNLGGVTTIDGVPALYLLTSGLADVELWIVDLETLEPTLVTPIETDEFTWITGISYADDRFFISTTSLVGCDTVRVIGRNGAPAAADHLPEGTCDGLPDRRIDGARVSPDGTRLAYLEGLAGPTDFDEIYNFEWVSPVDLVVIDLATGRELARRQITDERFSVPIIHAYDGRYVAVSHEPFEPAAADQTFEIIDLENPDRVVTFVSMLTNVALATGSR